MTKKTLISVLIFLSMPVHAIEWVGNKEIGQIRIDGGFTYLSTTIQPPKTCNLWGEYFEFDYKTDTGRAFYSALLSAKAAKQKIDIWYEASTAPDTDQNTGCNGNTAAKLIGIRIK
jgi:hypothetical protein